MRIVDFHNHFYPPEYVAALEAPASKSKVKVTRDQDGNPCVHYPGDYNILVPGHRDIDYRQRVLEDHGVTTQVLSFTTPGVHVESPEIAVEWARLVNDAFARIVRERGEFRMAGGPGWYPSDDGTWTDVWYYDDLRSPMMKTSVAAGAEVLEFGTLTFDEIAPSMWRQQERLAAMAINHMDASICFPNAFENSPTNRQTRRGMSSARSRSGGT